MSVTNTQVNHAPLVSVLASSDILAVEDIKFSIRNTPVTDLKVIPIGRDYESLLAVDASDLALEREPVNSAKLISALEYRSAEGYHDWWQGLACIKGTGLPEEQAKEIARNYSKKSAKYDESEFERVWNRIRSEGGYTQLTIYKGAVAAGWDGTVSLDAMGNLSDLDSTLFESEQKSENRTNSSGISALINKFSMSEVAISQLTSPSWLVDNLIIKGHMSVFPAAPNAGKTTIFVHIACELAGNGVKVIYINADISASDAKRDLNLAKQHDFNLLLPDLVGKGLSMENVVAEIRQMVMSGEDMGNTVFIFDTLKKMTDVINKSQAKDLFKLFRAMTARNATVICLAHTNKYNGLDGKPIYEGTGDLRADFDELIYLIPVKNADGSLTVSTAPDKVRGDFSPITFTINQDRSVRLEASFVDTEKLTQINRQRVADEEAIFAITNCINSGINTTEEIIQQSLNEYDIPRRKARGVLKRYKQLGSTQLWVATQSKTKNKFTYSLVGK